MKWQTLMKAVLIGWTANVAWAQAPATRPALPAGHPDISKMLPSSPPRADQPSAPSGSLPAGHPDVSQMAPTPKSTGAPNSAIPARMNLPAGHPDLPQRPAATSQPSVSGVLEIRAAQKTAGGPKVGRDAFSVELYVDDRLMEQVKGRFDENGRAQITGVPLALAPLPVVKVTHAGVEYQSIGEAFSTTTPTQQVEVPVYETADSQPAWVIRMRHVMAESVDGELQVTEMLAIDNPTDRAWPGAVSSEAGRVTFTLALPADATQIKLLAGFRDCCKVTEGNKLRSAAALKPGITQYQISYSIPAKNGTASLDITAPASTQNLMLFLPEDGTNAQATGLEFVGANDMGTGKRRFYRAVDRAAGDLVVLKVSGIAPKRAASNVSGDTAMAAQVVGGVGAGVVVVFAVAFFFVKGTPSKA